MSGQKIAIGRRYEFTITFVVTNNSTSGTILVHQILSYPDRVIGNDLINPNFRALAHACRLHGEFVNKTDEFMLAYDRCRSLTQYLN
ncbi:MAG: hypothetical protein CMM44_11445 [Rhodospirillaceae bacterium]|nr:hypothetical protein [Rhodospirillaceae bacterium]|tara:strand:- start:762 stop:1022 length:261 start_codon:yes stop_codon:yes gene_type:complete